ncbi:ABC transporter substrate-binding protein [Psittacicella hinzii]|uniref:Fe/B12 periplasmic-binding domain-containing protein n=1 Tax=Psittacicella hinzii TaxID=2028575 RepID=A0A3A1YIG6_9GAMM|nr:ABC transporter substrate-binding protein [Psittacicella hinzii]RIY37952.1 hypothetical protein CKF58_04390 [Psittacicella hinzii]
MQFYNSLPPKIKRYSKYFLAILVVATVIGMVVVAYKHFVQVATKSEKVATFKLIDPTSSDLCAQEIAQMPKAKIVTPDWTIAQTVLNLGVPIAGIGEKASYALWVNQPSLPEQTLDLGLRLQPNLEQLIILQPDIIFLSPMYQNLETTLASYAPVHSFDFTATQDIWTQIETQTQALANTLAIPTCGQTLITQTKTQIEKLAQNLKADKTRPIAVIQFIDSRNFRLYQANSLVNVAVSKLGLTNVSEQVGNLWGFTNYSLEKLADFPANTQLVIIKPYPQAVPANLANNTLWQALPLSKDALILDPIWTFGAITSSYIFAQALSQGLMQGGVAW